MQGRANRRFQVASWSMRGTVRTAGGGRYRPGARCVSAPVPPWGRRRARRVSAHAPPRVGERLVEATSG